MKTILALLTVFGISNNAFATPYPLSGDYTVVTTDCNEVGEFGFSVGDIIEISANGKKLVISKVISFEGDTHALEGIQTQVVGDTVFKPNAGGPESRMVGVYTNNKNTYTLSEADGGGSALNDLNVIETITKTADGIELTSFSSTCILKN